MKNKELLRAIKFTLFSISAGVIQLVVGDILLLNVLGWTYWVGYLIGLLLSVLWNFTLNRKFTFQSASNIPIAMLKVLLFYAVFTPLSTIGGKHLVDNLCPNHQDLVFILSMLLNFVLEFFYQRFFVFKNSLDTAKK